MQFVNKLLYAKEGVKDIVDRTCADLPWQVSLEVDGKNIEIPVVNPYSFLFVPDSICQSFFCVRVSLLI